MHTADHRCRLMAWTIGGTCKPRPPTCTSTSYGVGLVPALGGLELVDDSAAGKACPWTSIDERRSDHAKHQDSGFARRRQRISQLPLRRCQLSALGDWETGSVLGSLTNGALIVSLLERRYDGSMGTYEKGPGLVTHSRANHGHRWWEPNGGTGTTPGRKRLGNDQPCRRCQEHLDDVAPERRFLSSKWRRGPGPGPHGSRRLREPRGPEVSESLGRTMAIDWAEGSDQRTHCFPPAAPGA